MSATPFSTGRKTAPPGAVLLGDGLLKQLSRVRFAVTVAAKMEIQSKIAAYTTKHVKPNTACLHQLQQHDSIEEERHNVWIGSGASQPRLRLRGLSRARSPRKRGSGININHNNAYEALWG